MQLLVAMMAMAADAKYCTFSANKRSCHLCTASAAAPARANTVYYASGACDRVTSGEVILPGGTYSMAPGQTIESAAGVRVNIVGQLKVQHPNVRVANINTTTHISVSGSNCSRLEISDVVVTEDVIGVHVEGPRDGLGHIDATGATISNVVALQPGAAAAAIVNAVNGPSVSCAATALVVRDDPVPQPRSQVSPPCALLSLSDIFQIYGSKVELKIEDDEPPSWMGPLQTYNFYGTLAAALAVVAFITVKGPRI